LRSVGMEPGDVLEKFPFELSGGQMQRLLIARIFLIRPKILIADEPTSMIDACLRASILDLLLDLKKELKMCIIFITHDIGLSHYVSDRIFVMCKGKIVETGHPDEVIANPQHAYTKKLLDDIPVLHKTWINK
jgi:peptide/nickel transport system ATP-binding protein